MSASFIDFSDLIVNSRLTMRATKKSTLRLITPSAALRPFVFSYPDPGERMGRKLIRLPEGATASSNWMGDITFGLLHCQHPRILSMTITT